MSYVSYSSLDNHEILVVCGPTAVGKSDFAIQEALKLDGEIISADAYQVYRGMDIGTAKVSLKDLDVVPHYLIDILSPVEAYSVYDFLTRISPIIDDIRSRGKAPIICGGTAFYLQAFLYGYSFSSASVNEELQLKLTTRIDNGEFSDLVNELLVLEPQCENWMDLSNPRRVVRALVQLSNGISPSDSAQSKLSMRDDVQIVGLRMDRSSLVERINDRVDLMIEKGLVDEVQSLLNSGIPSDCLAFQGIGYKEVIEYLESRLEYGDMIDCIKVKSRQFAKRQMTWFKRFEQVKWNDLG